MSVATVTDGESVAPAAVAHPPCPSCGDGYLVPLTMAGFYVCTTPSCTYTISGQGTAVAYYKGHAVAETKEKGQKRWVEFNF